MPVVSCSVCVQYGLYLSTPQGCLSSIIKEVLMGMEAGVVPTQDPEARCPHQSTTLAGARSGLQTPQGFALLLARCFGSLGPTLLGQWPSSGQTLCSIIRRFAPTPLLHVFVGLLSWQLRLIRDPASHNVHRACLGETA